MSTKTKPRVSRTWSGLWVTQGRGDGRYSVSLFQTWAEALDHANKLARQESS